MSRLTPLLSPHSIADRRVPYDNASLEISAGELSNFVWDTMSTKVKPYERREPSWRSGPCHCYRAEPRSIRHHRYLGDPCKLANSSTRNKLWEGKDSTATI